MLVLPKRVPLKALKGFEGYMVAESVSYLKDLYLPLCQGLKRGWKTNILAFMKIREKAPFLLSNLILSSLYGIHVYKPAF